METEFSPYGTQPEIFWPLGAVGDLEVERATSDASAITLPIGSRRQLLDDSSLKTVDMAGRIMNYWRPTEIETLPKVVHEPSAKKDQDSVSSAETEPFDVMNERKKKEAEDAAKSPIVKFTEYLDDKFTAIQSDSGVEIKRPLPKLNLDALPSRRRGTSVLTNQSEMGTDTISEFSALNFKEMSSVGPESPNSNNYESKSDPGTPDSEFQRRLNHRRRLQRIRVLAAFEDNASQASFHSTGTPTKLRERRDREQKKEKRRKSVGYEDPLMRTAEPLVSLPEEEQNSSKTPGLSLVEDEYSLFSFEQDNQTTSSQANQIQNPQAGPTPNSQANERRSPHASQARSSHENQTKRSQANKTQSLHVNGRQSPQANRTLGLKGAQPGPRATISNPIVKSLHTQTIDEDRELPDEPANLDRINFEKIVGDEAIFSSTNRYENDTASVRSDYTKTDASELKDAIKDVLFLGDEAETRPGRRKKSTKDYSRHQTNVVEKGTNRRRLPGEKEELQKGGVWKELAFTLGFSPSDDENDDYTKYTEETQSIITKSPTSPRRQMERAAHYSSNPASPIRSSLRKNKNSTFDINQLQRRQQGGVPSDIFEGFPFPVSSLNSDHEFVLLALFAAQAVHELQGVRFDDSYPLDMYEDLKISVVELKMPLGLILMENAGGCFVTKIAADGSAARSGGVQVGDQLAAINGQKCLKMRVEDIYKIIMTIVEPVAVQLAFIRYIGPFRPETQFDEEDNSVIDTTRPRQTLRVVKDVSQKPTDKRKIRKWFRKLKGKNV